MHTDIRVFDEGTIALVQPGTDAGRAFDRASHEPSLDDAPAAEFDFYGIYVLPAVSSIEEDAFVRNFIAAVFTRLDEREVPPGESVLAFP